MSFEELIGYSHSNLLQTLRNLPSNTPQWRKLADLEEQQIYDEIIQLPDNIDLIKWLQQEHQDWAARVILRKAIQYIYSVWILGGYNYPIPPGLPPDEALYKPHLLGGLLHLDKTQHLEFIDQIKSFLFFPGEAVYPTPSPTSLLVIYKQLKDLRRTALISPAAAPNPTLHLYNELFSLPQETDPIDWLGKQYSESICIIALRRLLSMAIDNYLPVGQLHLGSIVEIWHPTESYSSPSNQLKVELAKVSCGEIGFSIELKVEIYVNNLALAVIPPELSIRWYGFDKLTDNLGQHYLLIPRKGGLGRNWQGTCSSSLTQWVYPALAAEATELILTASRPTLEITEKGQSPLSSTYLRVEGFSLQFKLVR